MKRTLNLDDELVTCPKTLAAQQHTSLRRSIEEGLPPRLNAVSKSRASPQLPVYSGKGGLASGLCGLCNKDFLSAVDQ